MLLAISLTLILQLFSGGLKSVRLSDHYTRAVFYAQEKMDEILLSEVLAPGVWEEELADGYRLTVRVSDAQTGRADNERLPAALFDVNLRVQWSEGRREKQFELNTLKLVNNNE